MISALFFVNLKGEIVIARVYRDDVSSTAANNFRLKVVAAKEAGSAAPVRLIDGGSFLYKRVDNLYVVAVTRSNANATLVFQFINAIVEIFRGYFSGKFDEETLRNNFSLVYELLDEVLDFGYPQTTAIDVLKLYINLGSVTKAVSAEEHAKMTSAITGARDWRREGIVYKQNQCFIDVLESVNMLVSTTGNIIRQDVVGKIAMKCELSGMPECKFALNDKLLLERKPGAGGGGGESAAASGGGASKRPGSVEMEDVTFHRCVQLNKFDADRSITFVPPDGEFELMQYRITDGVRVPFKVVPLVEELDDTRVVINLRVSATFGSQLNATNVTIKIPTPPQTARATFELGIGTARYEPAEKAIIWVRSQTTSLRMDA